MQGPAMDKKRTQEDAGVLPRPATQKKRTPEDARVLPRPATEKKMRWGFSRHLGSGSPEDDRWDAYKSSGSSAGEHWDAHKLGHGCSGSSAGQRREVHELGRGCSAADDERKRKPQVEDDDGTKKKLKLEDDDDDGEFAGPTFIRAPDPSELPSPILLLPACACELLDLPTWTCQPVQRRSMLRRWGCSSSVLGVLAF